MPAVTETVTQCAAERLALCQDYLRLLAHGADGFVAIPVLGDAAAASEAAIGAFLPQAAKLLVYSHRGSADRHALICRKIGLPHAVVGVPPWRRLCAAELAAILSRDPDITHVVVAHCEASTGMLNPVEEIAALCRRSRRKLLIDAALSFGALPLDLRRTPCQAVLVDSDKSLHGPSGLAWILADGRDPERSGRHPRSLADGLRQGPDALASRPGHLPANLICAFAQALREHRSEGGQPARLERYRRNHRTLVAGLRALGLETFLPDRLAAPMLAVFIAPELPRYSLPSFARKLAQHGIRVDAPAATLPGTFVIGCMGDLTEEHMAAAVAAIERALRDIGGPPPLGI